MTHTTPPILFVVFNRPDMTRRVFDAIRRARPGRLYVAADGPRLDRPGEDKICEEVRRIATDVDWECNVSTLFGTYNQGCGVRLTSAIGWFFEREEMGIVLEDDCLPSLSFFSFCAELLVRYRSDARVISIGGNNLESPSDREVEYSYTFSKLTYIWGWASWRRAWKLHDFFMGHYPEVTEKNYLAPVFASIHEKQLFEYIFEQMHSGREGNPSRRNSWDYQWQFAAFLHSGLTIVPSKNLVVNIGFGQDATSTTSSSPGRGLRHEEMDFPMKHPSFMMVDSRRERRTFELCHTSTKSRMRNRIRNILPEKLVSLAKSLL